MASDTIFRIASQTKAITRVTALILLRGQGTWPRPSSTLVMVFVMQSMPNSTDIRTRWPTLVYQAVTDTR
jgi:CubicO group peptidase (beta-lactamase class C family)